jgi:hypothetical protein
MLLVLAVACSTLPERDAQNCWSNDTQIWIEYWTEWCDALDSCGEIETYGPYPDAATCRADAHARTGSLAATCLNGCSTDACLAAVAHYSATCDVGEIPIGDCDIMLEGSNPYVSCDP